MSEVICKVCFHDKPCLCADQRGGAVSQIERRCPCFDEPRTLIEPVDWPARSDEWQARYWESVGKVRLLLAFAKKMADYSNDAHFAREAEALVAVVEGREP